MVQIIQENRRPSLAQRFSDAVGTGLQMGNQMMNEHQAKQRDQQAIETGKQLLGIDLSGFDPDTRKALLVEGLKQQGKGRIQQGKQDYLDQLFGGTQRQNAQNQNFQGNENETENIPSIESITGNPLPENFDATKFSDEDIARASSIDPNLGRALGHAKDVALRENRENLKSKEKKLASLKAETFPIRKEISDRADSSRRGIENKERLLDLIEKGDINDPTFAALAEALPLNLGKRMLSPDTVEYKAGLVDEFGDLRKIFQGQTRVKELEILEEKLPGLYLTDDQKKAILKSRINALKADLIREDVASDLEDKPLSLLQYRREVEKLAKPKLESLFNRILDEQKSIIQDAENQKKIPLDYDDPEGFQILEQLVKEAKGDRVKARKLAKERGYTIGK